jgi:acetoin utilization protein AcuC
MISLFYTDGFAGYNFGPDHPMKPARLMLAYKLMDEAGLLEEGDVQVIKPELASEADLLQVHTKDYIDAVRAERPNHSFGIGDTDTPAFTGMYDSARLIAGASIQAAECIIDQGDKAMNLAGGLHHAFSSRAAGFCLFNDPALAIARLRKSFKKVLYIDIDAHHGDGVQDIFYADRAVLKISMHESGKYLFPGTGFIEEVGSGPGRGYSVNVPMPMYSGDSAYRRAFEDLVPKLFEWFMPDVVVAQIGIDTHYLDPLSSLRMTLEGYGFLVKKICELADRYSEGRLLALGGGGYCLNVVPIAWAQALQILRHKELQALPLRWVELLENVAGLDPLELPDCKDGEATDSKAAEELEETLSGLKSILSDIHNTF